ncbi:hypothetical protein pb186bvf_013334 [Paramecium bursaria]
MIKQNKHGELIFIQSQKNFIRNKALTLRVTIIQKDDWLEQIRQLKAAGFVKRFEVYSRSHFKQERYYLMISILWIKRNKMHIGSNQLANAFYKLLFDDVFVFFETPKPQNPKTY